MPTRNNKAWSHFSENQNLTGTKIPKVSDRKRKCNKLNEYGWVALQKTIIDLINRSDFRFPANCSTLNMDPLET